MKARELQLSLEVGITGVFATGSDAYQDGWHDWQRYLALGAPLTALFIDEPITNGSRLSGLSYSTIVQETVNRIVLVSGPRDVIAIRPREKLFKDGAVS